MTKSFCLLLIRFYQSFLSPIKGFNCAHHRLHKGDTCSNAVKNIIIDNALRDVPTLVRARFEECKYASFELAQQRTATHHRSDMPCDISCADDIGCFGDAPSPNSKSTNPCVLPCEGCVDFLNLKRRTQILLLVIATIVGVALAYYYGSQITKLEITQLSAPQRSDGMFEKLLTRNTPSLRAMVMTSADTQYSDIIESSELDNGHVITLTFSAAISIDQLQRLELQDARFSAAQDLIVIGQVIEVIEQPSVLGRGQRFSYAFKSRWGF